MLESTGASFTPRTTRVQTPMAAQSTYTMGSASSRPLGTQPMAASGGPSARMNSLARSTSPTSGAVIS